MDHNFETKKALPFKVTTILHILFIVCFVVIMGYYLFSAPINHSNYDDLKVHISEDDTLSSLSLELKNQNIIKSEFLLKSFVYIFKQNGDIDKGDYLFERNSLVVSIAWQLARGEHKISPIKITLREGLTNNEMLDIFVEKLTSFHRDIFIEESYGKEGYLFPDTYFFYPMDTAEEVVLQLNQNFEKQIKKLDVLIKKSNYDLNDIITMASIIEKEAKGKEDAYIISGILWKRLEIGMPLQVDASPNTYKVKGLPSSPICNPGLVSIEASLKPVDSVFLYYLHGKDGKVHFAKSFEEHKRNINEYLR